jgi:hypothetical protein
MYPGIVDEDVETAMPFLDMGNRAPPGVLGAHVQHDGVECGDAWTLALITLDP